MFRKVDRWGSIEHARLGGDAVRNILRRRARAAKLVVHGAERLSPHGLRAGFVTEATGAAVYIPPSDRRFWLKSAQMWERTGTRIASVLIAGVVIAEFAKQVPAMTGPAQKVLVPSPLEVLGGIRKPRPLVRPAPHPSGGQGRTGMEPPDM